MRSHARIYRAGIAIFALGLDACAASALPPEPLKMGDIPPAWSQPIAASAEIWPASDWWRGLGNAELNVLVGAAREYNLDLAAAAARVLQAQAQTQISRAALFPNVGIEAGAQQQGAAQGGASATNSLFGVVGQASYQLDFWGFARSNVRAAEALLQSARYAQQTVALTVTTNVVTAYLDVLALRQRIAIATENLSAAGRVLDAVEKRQMGGLSSPLDLAQQQALVAGLAAEIPGLEQQEQEAVSGLALLLGQAPETVAVTGQNLDAIAIPNVAAGLPSELLLRRPDIAQAEANLLAANANIAAARAAFFPAIALTASGGLATGAMSAVTDGLVGTGVSAASGGTGLLFGIGVSVLQTIFDGGLREGQVALAQARQEELIADYRNTVFRAFVDAETALGQSANFGRQEVLKNEQVQRATTAFDISEVQYREGLVDLFALLQAQQTLFAAQDQRAQVRLARLHGAIALYRALGGGWNLEQSASTSVLSERR
jgi:NodT family efflux transporter outer membrane factor (OMF) lipoprotein